MTSRPANPPLDEPAERISDVRFARLQADARRAAAAASASGPGGLPGNDSGASAAGSHPSIRLFGLKHGGAIRSKPRRSLFRQLSFPVAPRASSPRCIADLYEVQIEPEIGSWPAGLSDRDFGRLDFYVGMPCTRHLGGKVRELRARPQGGVTISAWMARALAEFLARGRRNHPGR